MGALLSFPRGLPFKRSHAAIVLLCMSSCLLGTAGIWNDEKEDAQSEFQEEAQNRFAVVTAELDAQLSRLESFPSFYNGNGEMDPDRFHAFAQKLTAQDRSLKEVAWLPQVSKEKRAAWEQTARNRNYTEILDRVEAGGFMRAKVRENYFPVLFSEPGNRLPAGYDLAGQLSQAPPPAVSGNKNLARALVLERQKDGLSGCALAYPVFAQTARPPAASPIPDDLKGYVLCELELKNLFFPLFNRFKPIGMDIEVRDVSSPSAEAVLFRYSAPVRRQNAAMPAPAGTREVGLTLDRRFDFAGRRWSVRCVSVPGYFEVRLTLLFWLVAGSGLLVTGLVGALLVSVAQQGRRVQRLVTERTTQLMQSNRGLELEVGRRTEIEKELEASLAAKEVLLREVHHRVNNNLQVICSLMQLHAEHLSDVVARAAMNEMRDRVRSMALVYEKLQATDDRTRIDFAKYIQKLAAELSASHGGGQNDISVQFELENSPLNLDTAIPCGLILTELLTNAFKYAFAEDAPAQLRKNYPRAISIALHSNPAAQKILTVGDNGIGLPANIDLGSTRAMGLQLVSLMVEQINGSIALNRNEGTEYTIIFPGLPTSKETNA